MSIIKWKPKKCYDPFKDFFDLDRDFFSLSQLPAKDWYSQTGAWYPAVDVDEDDKNVTVKVDLPGLKKEDIDVSLHDSVLTVRGERKTEQEEKKKSFHRVERSYGAFERRLDLGTSVDGTKVDANYKEGVLTVTVPKSESSNQKKIEVK